MNKLVTALTEGIKVSVQTEYQAEYSRPDRSHYVFTYKILIENNSEYTVQLLRRHWYIYDSCGMRKEVEGEGVVGQQPIILPSESHHYYSGCHLKSDIGKMQGFYVMERLIDGKLFEVQIPAFLMMPQFRLS